MRPPQITDIKKFMVPAIDAAKVAGVKHFVFLSLVGIEKNTVVPHYNTTWAVYSANSDTFIQLIHEMVQ